MMCIRTSCGVSLRVTRGASAEPSTCTACAQTASGCPAVLQQQWLLPINGMGTSWCRTLSLAEVVQDDHVQDEVRPMMASAIMQCNRTACAAGARPGWPLAELAQVLCNEAPPCAAARCQAGPGQPLAGLRPCHVHASALAAVHWHWHPASGCPPRGHPGVRTRCSSCWLQVVPSAEPSVNLTLSRKATPCSDSVHHGLPMTAWRSCTTLVLDIGRADVLRQHPAVVLRNPVAAADALVHRQPSAVQVYPAQAEPALAHVPVQSTTCSCTMLQQLRWQHAVRLVRSGQRPSSWQRQDRDRLGLSYDVAPPGGCTSSAVHALCAVLLRDHARQSRAVVGQHPLSTRCLPWSDPCCRSSAACRGTARQSQAVPCSCAAPAALMRSRSARWQKRS